MKIKRYFMSVVVASLLISCGGGSENRKAVSSEDGVVRVTTYDSQKFDADMYEAEAGLCKCACACWSDSRLKNNIEGMEDDFKLEVGDEKTDIGEIDLKAGRYILYCDIAGHRTSGMEAKLLVS